MQLFGIIGKLAVPRTGSSAVLPEFSCFSVYMVILIVGEQPRNLSTIALDKLKGASTISNSVRKAGKPAGKEALLWILTRLRMS